MNRSFQQPVVRHLLPLGVFAGAMLSASALGAAPIVACDETEKAAYTVAFSAFADEKEPSGETRSVEVRIENGKPVVKINGKELTGDQIKIEGDKIILNTPWGTTTEFDTGKGWKVLLEAAPQMGEHLHRYFGKLESALKSEQQSPKVMIGIHMTEPPRALEAHFGLEPGAATMISGLYKGLPAYEAGLREFDVIIAIDGKKPAGPGVVREMLAQRNPGDVVKVTAIQKGATRDLAITLAAFDASKWDAEQLIGSNPTANVFTFTSEGEPARIYQRFFDGNSGESRWMADTNAQLFRIPVEVEPGEAVKPSAPRIAARQRPELEDRLDRLNERMAQIEGMLNRLIEETVKGSGTGSGNLKQ